MLCELWKSPARHLMLRSQRSTTRTDPNPRQVQQSSRPHAANRQKRQPASGFFGVETGAGVSIHLSIASGPGEVVTLVAGWSEPHQDSNWRIR